MHFSMYACTGKTAPAFISHYFAMHICREFDEVKLPLYVQIDEIDRLSKKYKKEGKKVKKTNTKHSYLKV